MTTHVTGQVKSFLTAKITHVRTHILKQFICASLFLILPIGENVTPKDAADLSTLFDVGGIVGGILAGLLSDATGKSAATCAVMLTTAIPLLFSYKHFGDVSSIISHFLLNTWTLRTYVLCLLGLPAEHGGPQPLLHW